MKEKGLVEKDIKKVTVNQSDKRLVKVWNTKVKGQPVRVATIEQGPRKEGMCEDCPAPCCKGFLRPVLTEDEFKNRKFPTLFLTSPDWLKEKVPRAECIATLGGMNDDGCQYFDKEKHICTIWPNCPKSCLSYDCRKDTRPEVVAFVKKWKPIWEEKQKEKNR